MSAEERSGRWIAGTGRCTAISPGVRAGWAARCNSGGYGAVVCVHVIPAMMMTALKQSVAGLPGVLLRGHGLHLQPHGGRVYAGYLRHPP